MKENLEKETRNISLSKDRRLKRMTTVIGIKCVDGIVIASDSQATSEAVKDLQTSKIFPINNSIMVGAAGTIGHIRVLIEELTGRLATYSFESDQVLRTHIDNLLVDIHRVYNLERSARLGYAQPKIIFDAVGLLGARLTNGTFCLYTLNTYQPWVSPVDNYETIGSGSLRANLVLKQQSRIPKSKEGKSLSQLTFVKNLFIAIYTINEIKQIEPYTGGNTKVWFLDKDGLKEIPDDKVSQIYMEAINKASESLASRQETAELGELLKGAYPPG